MLSIFTAGLVMANITAYPAYGDRGLVKPRAIEQSPRVEATTDKGPILEIIIRCHTGTAIISYSKVERKYCSPKLICGSSMAAIMTKSCG